MQRSKVLHRRILRLEKTSVLAQIGDLQNVAFVGRGDQKEILVTFAGQRRGGDGESEQVECESRGDGAVSFLQRHPAIVSSRNWTRRRPVGKPAGRSSAPGNLECPAPGSDWRLQGEPRCRLSRQVLVQP